MTIDMNRHVFREDMQMANRLMKKRCSRSWSSRKCRSKLHWDNTSHLSRMAVCKKGTNSSAGESVEKGTPVQYWCNLANWCRHCGKQYGLLRKLRTELPQTRSKSLLEIYQTTLIQKIQTDPNAHLAALFMITKDMEATSVSVNRWTDEDIIWYVYTVILINRKEWNPATCNNVDGLGGITLSEINPAGKDKYCMISVICGI